MERAQLISSSSWDSQRSVIAMTCSINAAYVAVTSSAAGVGSDPPSLQTQVYPATTGQLLYSTPQATPPDLRLWELVVASGATEKGGFACFAPDGRWAAFWLPFPIA